MKKLMLIFLLVMVAVIAYPQATPVADVRIPNATTAFGSNLPLGTKVYNIADGKYWVATAGVISTATLTTASGSFTQLNATVTGTNIGIGTVTSTTVPLTSSTGTGVNLPVATPSLAGLQSAADKSKLDGISVTGTNTGDQTITLTGGVTGSGTGSFAATVVTNANLTGPVTSIGNATTITAGAVTTSMMANMAANTLMGNNTGSAAAPVAMTKAQTLTLLNANRSQENFELSGDSLRGAVIMHLANTPVSGTITVILNGMPLSASASQFSIVQTSYVRIALLAYQYDKISVAYSY